MTEAKFNIKVGDRQEEVAVSLDTYRAAEEQGLTLAQYLNLQYTDCNMERDGTPFAQMMASCGLFLQEDRHFGIRPPTLKSILDGTATLSGTAIIRPDGSNSRSPAGRMLFPAVLLELLESVLRDNKEQYIGAMMEMVAFTRSITSPKYEQVVINYTNPQNARGMPIGQLSRPTRMLTITTSDVTRTIPTYSIGLEISREALAAATLDLIGFAVREHALEERAAAMDNDFVAMSNGDTDSGQSALSSITAASLDGTISAAGVLTQKAWIKFLRRKWRKRTITNAMCDMDTYLAIEGRTGRPVKEHEPAQDERLNTVPQVRLPGIPGGVSIFITETSILGANTILGLDKSKAARRIIYTGAEYTAVEEFVMRKAQVMRMDWAERIERAGYDEAFDKMTLTV